MCVYSLVAEHYLEKWGPKYYPDITWPTNPTVTISNISYEEFSALKKEVEDLKALLKKAKIYDEQTGQKDCEMEDKVAFIKKIAEFVGVDLSEVINK